MWKKVLHAHIAEECRLPISQLACRSNLQRTYIFTHIFARASYGIGWPPSVYKPQRIGLRESRCVKARHLLLHDVNQRWVSQGGRVGSAIQPAGPEQANPRPSCMQPDPNASGLRGRAPCGGSCCAPPWAACSTCEGCSTQPQKLQPSVSAFPVAVAAETGLDSICTNSCSYITQDRVTTHLSSTSPASLSWRSRLRSPLSRSRSLSRSLQYCTITQHQSRVFVLSEPACGPLCC